jgi:2'-5' RNA ligase
VKLFLGVPVSDAIRDRGGELSQRLRARLAASTPLARISWVPPERFHVTVLFIGHVSASQADAVRRALEPPWAEGRFDLTIAGTGVFPPSGPPRVVWAGCGDGVDAFVRLQREAHARLTGIVPLEPEREARPHLTLARVKEPAGLRARALLEGTEQVSLGSIPVEAVTLFESRGSRGGVEYLPLLTTPLAS